VVLVAETARTQTQTYQVMRASELTQRLRDITAKHGDLEVMGY